MKTQLVIALATLILPASVLADEVPDTIRTISNANTVIVTRSGDRSQIVVEGTTDNPDFYYSYTSEVKSDSSAEKEWELSLPFLNNKTGHRCRTECIWGENVYLGVTSPVSKPYGLNGSIEFGIGKIVGLGVAPWTKGPQFAIGIGIHYRQYTLHHSQIFSVDNHVLSIIDAGTDRVSSRLRNFGFQIPVTIFQPFGNGIGLTVGAAAVLNTYTRASSRATFDDIEYTNNYKGLHQRLLTADIFAILGWKNNFGIYVRYTPTSLFEKQWGPQFNTLSFGISLAM